MKKMMCSLAALILGCIQMSVTHGAVSLMGRGYDPKTIYAGPFRSQMLYYRNPGGNYWLRGFDRELNAVTCRSAVISLRTTGTWQGHLKPDGSCADPAEPSEWALGNKLNFDGVPAVRRR